MKRKAMAFLVTLAMVLSLLPFAAFAADVSYTDISGHWGESSIERWTEEGVVNGVGNDKFRPDDNMLRAEAAAVFARLLELVKTADISQFTDVNADDWFAGYISENVAYKIMNGTSATTMDPNDFITREQFFTIFARAMGIPGQDECNKDFSDLGDVSDWAAPSVNALINLGYVNGISDTKIAPQMFITRAMVMKVLDNGISDYLTESGTYSVSGRGIVIALADNVALKGNFSGWVVGSMDDGTIDLTGVNGAPEMWILKDNVKIVKEPAKTWSTIDPDALSSKDSVGAWITTSSVAFGTVSTGKDVANDSKAVIKGARSGGGGSSSSADKYEVNVNLYTPFSNTPFNMMSRFNDDASVSEIVNALISENKDGIESAYSAFVANFFPKSVAGCTYNGELGTFAMDVDEDYVLSATFTKDSDGTTVVVPLPSMLEDAGVSAACDQAMNDAAANYGMSGDVSVFNPMNYVEAASSDSNNVQLPTVDEIADIAETLSQAALALAQSADLTNANLRAIPVGVCTAANDGSVQTIGDIIDNHGYYVSAIQNDEDVLVDSLAIADPYTALKIDYSFGTHQGDPNDFTAKLVDEILGNIKDTDIAALIGTVVNDLGTYTLEITGETI